MKYILLFLLLPVFFFKAQHLKIDTLLADKISIRAIEIDGGKVWYVGTDSKFGFVDILQPKIKKQIVLASEKLQFRTLGHSKTDFYAINIESPAFFFKINKKSLAVAKVYTDTLKTAFYDAMHFVNPKRAYAFSDPDQFGNLQLAVYRHRKGWEKKYFSPPVLLKKGEAAFAASNSNIASKGKYVWIATGGVASRILRIDRHSGKLELFETPFVQGTSSRGIYAIDFYNQNFGIAVGGDYTQPQLNTNNIATTRDGGRTWQVQASGKNAGYSTSVRFRPGTRGREILAIGDRHISLSKDFGQSWQQISDEKNLYAAEWVDKNTIIAAGKDRILKIKIP